MNNVDIIYGSPQQVMVVKRANALWALIAGDPRFSFQARCVSLTQEQTNSADIVIALSRLQGYASCHFVPKQNVQNMADAYEVAGLRPAIWNQCWGRESAISKSKSFMSDFNPPEGLLLKTVTPQTPDAVIHAICKVSVASGVMPVPGSAMRGAGPKGMILYIEDRDGEVLATGGAFMAYHADSARADEAFWGMLATDVDWRGQRLACWIGAQVILQMTEQFGARGFSSGVKSDNPASQAMCARLGVGPSDMAYVGATDPEIMGDASITR